MKVERIDKGEVFINGILIDKEIFNKGKVDYRVVEREQQIDDLFIWIGEAISSSRTNDVALMKEDLKYLNGLDDENVFSSISTNEFIAKSDNEEEFNKICDEILKLNKLPKVKEVIKMTDEETQIAIKKILG